MTYDREQDLKCLFLDLFKPFILAGFQLRVLVQVLYLASTDIPVGVAPHFCCASVGVLAPY